jgi:mono/diheme cytochrome c family protein
MKKAAWLAFAIVVVLVWPVAAQAAPDGKALYSAKCASCHGADGVPKKMGAGSKAFGDPEFKKTATADSIVKDIKQGKGKMKPVKHVTDEEAAAIAAHILTIGAAK